MAETRLYRMDTYLFDLHRSRFRMRLPLALQLFIIRNSESRVNLYSVFFMVYLHNMEQAIFRMIAKTSS